MSNSILDKNQLKLIDLIGQIPTLYYPTFNSYLMDCGSTKYPNSQLFKNTCELRYLLEKIKRGSLEDIYPPLFTNNITISDILSLQSQLNILFSSGISIEELIKLLSQFNINFENKVSLEEVSSLISNLNIIFKSNITIDEIIKIISQYQIAFNNNISIENFIQLLNNINILFNSELNVEEALGLISNFNTMLENNINFNNNDNLVSCLDVVCNNNLDIIREVYKKLSIDDTKKLTIENLNDTKRTSGTIEIKLKFKPKSAFPSGSQTIVNLTNCFSNNIPSSNTINIGIDPEENGFRINAYDLIYPPKKASDGVTDRLPFVTSTIIELTLLMKLYDNKTITLTIHNESVSGQFSQHGVTLNNNFICNLFNNDFIGDFYYLYITWIPNDNSPPVSIIKLDAGSSYNNSISLLESGIFQNYDELTNTHDGFYPL